MNGLVLAVSMTLQFTAATLALRLIAITRHRWAWGAIAAAMTLMGVRRAITLGRWIAGHGQLRPDPSAEAVALVISVLLVAGVAAIAPLFRRIEEQQRTLRDNQDLLREARDELEERVRERTAQLEGLNLKLAAEVEERRSAEAALRAHQSMQRALLQAMPDLMFRIRADGTFLDYHVRGSQAALGVPAERFLGRTVFDMLPRELAERTVRHIARALATQEIETFEYQLELRGQLRNYEARVVANAPDDAVVISRDITERVWAEGRLQRSLEQLRESEDKLRRLGQRQVAIREAERKRLGLDLHDSVSQELVGAQILVESVRQRLGASHDSEELDRVATYLGEVVEHLRQLAHELRPLQLQDLGLEDGLRALARGLSSEATRVNASFTTPVPRLDEDTEVAVYRIAQEALANAVRHAGARHVTLDLGIDERQLRLVVEDDGGGFDTTPASTRLGMGLVSMDERTLALGGRLSIRSRPGAGTTVTLELPLAATGDRAS